MKHQSDPRVKIISFRWRGIQKLGEGKCITPIDILLALKGHLRARIPTEPGFGPVSSVGSSHNRPTSAEDNEEALLLGCPPIGPFWGRASL